MTAEKAGKELTGNFTKKKTKKKKKSRASKNSTLKENVTEVTATTKSLLIEKVNKIGMTTIKKLLKAVKKMTAATVKVNVLVAATAEASREADKARKEVEEICAELSTVG